MRLKRNVSGDVGAVLIEALGDVCRSFLKRPVLQQPGKEKIACLEVGFRRVVLLVDARQEVRRLHVEQSSGHHQKLCRTGQVRRGFHERDELVGHLRERDLGDVEFLARDQRQKKIERTFKNRE